MARRITVRVTDDTGRFYVQQTVTPGADLDQIAGHLSHQIDALKVDGTLRGRPLKARVGVMVNDCIHNPLAADSLESQCLRILGKDEMVTRGSRWRRRAAEAPEKLRNVLSELRTCQREGKAIRNAGAYAEHMWSQFA